jgi:hypothetical protein
MSFAGNQMELEVIMLGKISQAYLEGQIAYVLSLLESTPRMMKMKKMKEEEEKTEMIRGFVWGMISRGWGEEEKIQGQEDQSMLHIYIHVNTA